jgi:putative FmdB family regulatory protein
MPTYEYVCRNCGRMFEIAQSMSDAPLTICDVCGGELRKVFTAPAISFKGSGFYATDSRKKGDKPAAKTTEKKEAANASEGGMSGTSSEGSGSDTSSKRSGSDASSERSSEKSPETSSEKKDAAPKKESTSS